MCSLHVSGSFTTTVSVTAAPSLSFSPRDLMEFQIWWRTSGRIRKVNTWSMHLAARLARLVTNKQAYWILEAFNKLTCSSWSQLKGTPCNWWQSGVWGLEKPERLTYPHHSLGVAWGLPFDCLCREAWTAERCSANHGNLAAEETFIKITPSKASNILQCVNQAAMIVECLCTMSKPASSFWTFLFDGGTWVDSSWVRLLWWRLHVWKVALPLAPRGWFGGFEGPLGGIRTRKGEQG